MAASCNKLHFSASYKVQGLFMGPSPCLSTQSITITVREYCFIKAYSLDNVPFELHAPLIPYRWTPVVGPTADDDVSSQAELCQDYGSGPIYDACIYEEFLWNEHTSLYVLFSQIYCSRCRLAYLKLAITCVLITAI